MGEVIIGQLDPQTNRRLTQAVDDAANKIAGYKLAEDYFEGRHRIRLTERARKYLEASGQPYAHNFCERVVEAVEDKLIIDGFSVKVTLPDNAAQDQPLPTAATPPTDNPEATTPAKAGSAEATLADAAGKVLTEWLEQHLDVIGFDEIAAVVHHDYVCKGDGYAQPYYDHDHERPEITYERPENCVPFYVKGKPHQLEYVAKTWCETNTSAEGAEVEQRRLNLYYPDRIEKYVELAAGDWRRWWDIEDGYDEIIDASAPVDVETDQVAMVSVPRWPVPWVRSAIAGEAPEPRGLGFAHFRNKTRGKRYGMSELHNVYPQQDAINKRMVDLDLVNDNQGYAQRWATGVPTGTKLLTHPGAVWTTPKETAKFGQFPPGDPTGIIKTIDTQVQHLAGTTATPVHSLLISGEPPSGEALKTAEGPFVSKTGRKMASLGRGWSDILLQVLFIALDHALVVVPGLDGATITIEVHWASAETRNEKEHWETQMLKQAAGVSKATTLEEDGYPADREAERRAEEATAATNALTNSINRGSELP